MRESVCVLCMRTPTGRQTRLFLMFEGLFVNGRDFSTSQLIDGAAGNPWAVTGVYDEPLYEKGAFGGRSFSAENSADLVFMLFASSLHDYVAASAGLTTICFLDY